MTPYGAADAGRWRNEASTLLRDTLPAALAVLAAGCALMAVSQAVQAGRRGAGLAAATAALAAGAAGGAAALRRWALPPAWANPLGMALVALVGVDLAAFMAVQRDAAHSYHFVNLLVASGLLFLSRAWLGAAWLVALGLWSATVALARVPVPWVPTLFLLVGGVVMSTLAYLVRVKMVLRLLESRRREEQKQHELSAASGELSQRERQYRQMFTQMLNGFALHEVVFDATGAAVDFRYLDVNQAFEKLTGLSRAQVIGRRATEVLPGLEPVWAQRYGSVAVSGQPLHFEDYVAAVDRYYEGVAYPLERPRVAVVFSEITQRVRSAEALRRREAHYRAAAEANRRLLSEVNHRVRNNLASLLGLLALMRRRVTGVEQFGVAIEERLRAMAHIHNLLAQVNWSDVALDVLVRNLFGSLQNTAAHPAVTTIEGPPVRLVMRQITPLAMALAELFTNSCKHGAHRSDGGTLAVTWTVADQGDHQRVTLRWRERCAQPIPVTPPRSLGLELIEGFVTFELGGEADLHFTPDGADHTLIFATPRSEPRIV